VADLALVHDNLQRAASALGKAYVKLADANSTSPEVRRNLQQMANRCHDLRGDVRALIAQLKEVRRAEH
jgi:hypothetical protein